MSATFNWGLLSTAKINLKILQAAPHSIRGQILGVASRDAERARAYAAEHGLARHYGSYAAMLADPDIHIIYNGLPNSLHAEWTIKALEAGKHVLCEKPFAVTLAEVDAMHAAAQRAGRVVTEAFMYRHHPRTFKVKELIESGALGPVRLLRSGFSFNMSGSPANVRWNKELAGGSIWDVGCYPISLARYLFGAPSRVHGWKVLSASGVDETFVGTLEFPGGQVAQFDSSFNFPHRVYAEIVGSAGSLYIERPFQPSQPEHRLTLRRDGRPEEVIEIENPDMYWLEMEDLHDAILGGQPRISAAETRGHIETILALLAAADQA
ncbi:MAG: Gfo/Idh/MocA family oxidoreductase [Anaerolineales bacterium]|nr:Gfo/Idh/MocA family oxidoreductase [Anaerolineales bacterium]